MFYEMLFAIENSLFSGIVSMLLVIRDEAYFSSQFSVSQTMHDCDGSDCFGGDAMFAMFAQ